jgi:hypothetical protein
MFGRVSKVTAGVFLVKINVKNLPGKPLLRFLVPGSAQCLGPHLGDGEEPGREPVVKAGHNIPAPGGGSQHTHGTGKRSLVAIGIFYTLRNSM